MDTQTTILNNGSTKPVVLYDGGCPLCQREIAHYRRLDRQGSIRWLDLTDPAITLPGDVDREAAMKRMHVRDVNGHWHTGAWAFAELWSHLPFYHLPARLVRGTGTLPLMDRVYTGFARWRLRKRCSDKHCPTSAAPDKTDPPSSGD